MRPKRLRHLHRVKGIGFFHGLNQHEKRIRVVIENAGNRRAIFLDIPVMELPVVSGFGVRLRYWGELSLQHRRPRQSWKRRRVGITNRNHALVTDLPEGFSEKSLVTAGGATKIDEIGFGRKQSGSHRVEVRSPPLEVLIGHILESHILGALHPCLRFGKSSLIAGIDVGYIFYLGICLGQPRIHGESSLVARIDL